MLSSYNNGVLIRDCAIVASKGNITLADVLTDRVINSEKDFNIVKFVTKKQEIAHTNLVGTNSSGILIIDF